MGVPARVEWPFRRNRCQGYKRCPHGISWWLPTTQVMDMDQAGFLKQTPLFSGLSEKEIASVLGTAREREFAAGDSIISDGQEGGVGFYLILSGTAEARKGETLLAEFGPGATARSRDPTVCEDDCRSRRVRGTSTRTSEGSGPDS